MNRGGRGQPSRGGYNSRYSSRGRGYGGRGRGVPRSTELKGVFADGIWNCECKPRLPAEHFKVKKETKNKGRWFYTCQNQAEKRCDFFLWHEDAKLREEGAVLNNSRSEPQHRQVSNAQDGWAAGRTRTGIFANIDPTATKATHESVGDDDATTDEGSPPPAYSSQQAGSKRKAEAADLNQEDDYDDELLPWPLTGQEEQDLVAAADSRALPPETPRKAVKTGIYATPVTTVQKMRTLPWLQQPYKPASVPRTPSLVTDQQKEYMDSPSKPPTKALPPITEQAYGPTPTLQASTPKTQSKSPSPPNRHRDALANPADKSSSLTNEALATLAGTSIPPSVLSNLRGILSKHDLKSQGIAKGRDISRLALKAKEAKIMELQARIASFKAEREVDRSVIRSLRLEDKNGSHGVLQEE
jgi:LysM repeat protein